MMRTFSVLTIAAVSVAFVAARAEEDAIESGPRAAATSAIRENEKKFYEMGLEQGTRAAFL
ncbi:MAG: hypothetical protein ACXWG7_00755, partial [Chthoniobacterales bacterium]